MGKGSSEVVVFKLISTDQVKSFKPRFRGIDFPGKNSCVEVWRTLETPESARPVSESKQCQSLD